MAGLRRRAPLRVTAKTVLAGGAAAVLTGLVACGSSVTGGAGEPAAGHSPVPAAALRASAGVPLCAAAQRVDLVEVTLVPASPASPSFREFLPRTVTIRNRPRVRALAAGLCGLPPRPAGVQCPAELGGGLKLVFVAGSRNFQPVRIGASGCRVVTGAGPARWWSRHAQFGTLLSSALGGAGWRPLGSQPSGPPQQ